MIAREQFKPIPEDVLTEIGRRAQKVGNRQLVSFKSGLPGDEGRTPDQEAGRILGLYLKVEEDLWEGSRNDIPDSEFYLLQITAHALSGELKVIMGGSLSAEMMIEDYQKYGSLIG